MLLRRLAVRAGKERGPLSPPRETVREHCVVVARPARPRRCRCADREREAQQFGTGRDAALRRQQRRSEPTNDPGAADAAARR